MSNYPFDTFPLTKRVGIVNSVANLDARYGPWPTFNDALTGFSSAIRHVGLTVAVTGVNGVTEYWYKDGIQNNNLVLKTASAQVGEVIPTVTNYLSTNSVQISALTLTNTLSSVSTLSVSGNTVIDVNNSLPALKITQRGTGPAFYFEDNEADNSPVVIDQFGTLVVGASAGFQSVVSTRLAQFISTSSSFKRMVEIRNHSTSTTGFPEFRLIRTRSGQPNDLTPSQLSANDILGRIGIGATGNDGFTITAHNKYPSTTGQVSGAYVYFRTNLNNIGLYNSLTFNEDKAGFGTLAPNEALTVVGSISSTAVVFASGGNSNIWNSLLSFVSQTSGNWTGGYQIIPESVENATLDTSRFSTFYKVVSSPTIFSFQNVVSSNPITIYLFANHDQATRHYFPGGTSLTKAGSNNIAYTFENKITRITLQHDPLLTQPVTWVGVANIIDRIVDVVIPPLNNSLLLDVGLGYLLQEDNSYILLD